MKMMHAPTLIVLCSCAYALNVQKAFLRRSGSIKPNVSSKAKHPLQTAGEERMRSLHAAKQTADQSDSPIVSNNSKQSATLAKMRVRGFELCRGDGKLAYMRPKSGNMFNGRLQKPVEEQRVIDIVKQLVQKHNIEINYVLDGPGYIAEHALPILHVLPGKYWTLNSALYPASRAMPSTITLNNTNGYALARSAYFNNRSLILTWTNQEGSMGEVGANPQIVMMPHGDDEDLQWYHTYGIEPDKVLQRPFQDMAYSNYMIANKYADPTAVSGWIDAKLDQTFVEAPCRRRGAGCHGVVLISVPGPVISKKDTRNRASCKLPDDVWKPIVANGWLLMVTFHPNCSKFGVSNLPSYVYIDDNAMGLGIKDLVAKATVLVTSSGGLISMVSAGFIDKPVVRIPSHPERFEFLANAVWNSNMGVIYRAFDSGLVSAVQRAFDEFKAGTVSRNAALAARRKYQERYMWKLDGFEEYRNALALLSLVVPDLKDLMELKNAVHNLTRVPFRPFELYKESYNMGMLDWSLTEKLRALRLEARTRELWNYFQLVA